MNNTLLERAESHAKKYYKPPEVYTSKDDLSFLQKCYSSFAAKEILEMIKSGGDISSSVILDGLQDMMCHYSTVASEASTSEVSFMFSVFEYTICDFVDVLL